MHDQLPLALALIEIGHFPVRVELGTKAPAYAGWQKIAVTADSAPQMFARPSNIGIRTGDVREDGTSLIAIDVDTDEHRLLAAVASAIGERKAPCKRGKKGATWFLRIVGQTSSTKIYWMRGGAKKPVIDILCRGAQSVIPPSIHPDTGQPYHWVTGPSLDKVPYRDIPLISQSAIDEIRGFCRSEDDPIAALNNMDWRGVGGGGNTHDVCLAATASMVSRGWSDEDTHARIDRAKREACERAGVAYDWSERQKIVQGWIDSARAKNFGSNPAGTGKQTHGVMADRYAAEHGAIVRYDRDRSSWSVFGDGYWKPNSDHLVWHSVERFLPPDLRNGGTVSGVIRSLENRPELSIVQVDWDRNRHLLHTPAGTVDLKTGRLQPASPCNYISKSTSVAPAPLEADSLWRCKLVEWFGDDEVELEYVQMLAGYLLTGETRHPCLPIWIGPGGDGKSVITNAFKAIMGDYARTSTDTAFIESRHAQHSEEIAWLCGTRLVLVAEVSGNWHEPRIKAVTGGESMAAAFKFGRIFEFVPNFKLLVTGNQAPRLRSVGPEFRRRIHVYQFSRGVSHPDPHLSEKLRVEYGQILTWMIEGAVKYYAKGLTRSPVVERASEEYLSENDVILQWMEERACVDTAAKVVGQTAYRDYADWCEGAGIRFPLSREGFTRLLKGKGFETKTAAMPGHGSPVRIYIGFSLRAESERTRGPNF